MPKMINEPLFFFFKGWNYNARELIKEDEIIQVKFMKVEMLLEKVWQNLSPFISFSLHILRM